MIAIRRGDGGGRMVHGPGLLTRRSRDGDAFVSNLPGRPPFSPADRGRSRNDTPRPRVERDMAVASPPRGMLKLAPYSGAVSSRSYGLHSSSPIPFDPEGVSPVPETLEERGERFEQEVLPYLD